MLLFRLLSDRANHNSYVFFGSRPEEHDTKIKGVLTSIGINDSDPLDPSHFQAIKQADSAKLINNIFEEHDWNACQAKIQEYLLQRNSFTSLYRKIQEDLSEVTQEKKRIKRAYLILHEIDQHIREGKATLYQLISNIFARIFLKASYWSTINYTMSVEALMTDSEFSPKKESSITSDKEGSNLSKSNVDVQDSDSDSETSSSPSLQSSPSEEEQVQSSEPSTTSQKFSQPDQKKTKVEKGAIKNPSVHSSNSSPLNPRRLKRRNQFFKNPKISSIKKGKEQIQRLKATDGTEEQIQAMQKELDLLRKQSQITRVIFEFINTEENLLKHMLKWKPLLKDKALTSCFPEKFQTKAKKCVKNILKLIQKADKFVQGLHRIFPNKDFPISKLGTNQVLEQFMTFLDSPTFKTYSRSLQKAPRIQKTWELARSEETKKLLKRWMLSQKDGEDLLDTDNTDVGIQYVQRLPRFLLLLATLLTRIKDNELPTKEKHIDSINAVLKDLRTAAETANKKMPNPSRKK